MPEAKSTRENVFAVISGERDYQQRKWGPTTDDKRISSYLLYMQHHMNRAIEIAATVKDDGGEEALAYIRKVTTLGVACMEQHGAPPRTE